MYGGVYVVRYERQCQCDYAPLKPDTVLQWEIVLRCYEHTGKGREIADADVV